MGYPVCRAVAREVASSIVLAAGLTSGPVAARRRSFHLGTMALFPPAVMNKNMVKAGVKNRQEASQREKAMALRAQRAGQNLMLWIRARSEVRKEN
jgi:hypothetical protein